jgi:propionate CoA-transferase
MNERLTVSRRASMELRPNTVVNIGVGLPDGIGSVVSQEDVSDLMTLTSEVGVIGGVPGIDTAHGRANFNFGVAYNSDAQIEHQAQFDWYDGGGVDLSFLGLAQTDKQGNVNVSRFFGRAIGVGGFVNISQGAKKLVYCGTFTVGGLEVAIGDGKLTIVKEGREKKFLDRVEQISFSGAQAEARGQIVLYVTERAVFELRNGTMTLIEIAPGIDVERDVLAQMDFKPAIADKLAITPTALFEPTWGALRALIESY